MHSKKTILFFILICLTTLLSANGYDIGERVLAYWEESSLYYIGTVVEYDNTVKGGGYYVVFEDGSQDVIPTVNIRPFNLVPGSKVLGMWRDGNLYAGTIVKITGNAIFIQFDDGDKAWTSWSGIAVEP